MVSRSTSKAFPGFSNVYVLDEGSSTAFRGKLSQEDFRDCFTIFRAERTPPAPLEVRHAMGRNKPSDFVYASAVYPIMISDRVLGILQGGGFTGWRTYPIHLYGKDGARVPGYHGLAIHGRCGFIDDSRSVKLDKIYPGGVFPAWYGLYFDPESWDGSDLFMTAGETAYVIVVDAVKRALEKAKITNAKFKALDQIEVWRAD
jgi:hypothetical protein